MEIDIPSVSSEQKKLQENRGRGKDYSHENTKETHGKYQDMTVTHICQLHSRWIRVLVQEDENYIWTQQI